MPADLRAGIWLTARPAARADAAASWEAPFTPPRPAYLQPALPLVSYLTPLANFDVKTHPSNLSQIIKCISL